MITFNTRELQRALKELQPAVGNSIISICDHVLCTVKDNTASLRATNTHRTIIVSLSCESSDIELLLPFYDVFKPLASMKGETVVIESRKKIKMTCGDERFSFSSEDAKNFPEMVNIDRRLSFDVSDDFIADMQEASKHVSTNEMNVQYTGVGLFLADGKCTIMATNASKIFSSWYECGLTGKYHVPVVFTKAVSGSGELILSDNFIGLSQENKQTYMRLFDQSFMAILPLIRKDTEHNLSFALSDILPKLDIITSYAGTATVKLSFLGNQMDVSYINKDFEREYCSSIACINYSGIESITFNPGSLRSLLIAAQQDDCKLWLAADNKPAYIFGQDRQMILSPQVNN